MKIEIYDGRVFNYRRLKREEDLRTMTDDELMDLRKDVVDEREGCSDMSCKGLALDEVCGMIDNELDYRKEHPHPKNNFIATIIDNLEDWLDEKGVQIPNNERDKDDPDNSANFYGEDFDWAMEMIRDVCAKNGIIVEDEWEN